MLIDFILMQAQGNDFVILDGLAHDLPELDHSLLARDVCERRFGIGADGLVLLQKSLKGSARMTIYNSDGSRARMCGSALRCVSLLLSRKLGEKNISLETDSGIRESEIIESEAGELIRVNMGKPVILEPELQAGNFTGSLVDVGNLHYVVFTESLEDDPHLRYGSLLEHHPAFPTAVNVHFVKRISDREIEIKIWERGAGATYACGTGATASVCSGILLRHLDNNVRVNMPGGQVLISRQVPSEDYFLTGEVNETGYGTYIWRT